MTLPPINPVGVNTAFQFPAYSNQGPGIRNAIDADPGSVNTPILYEPPFNFTNGAAQLWMFVSGANPNFGGAQVWMSLDGTTYGQLGVILTNVIQGVLTATFPTGSDPDTVNTLSVNLTESRTNLLSFTTNDADHDVSLCYCDGELIAFSTATMTSAFHYSMGTYIRRGLFGTPISSHASGSNFGQFTNTTFVQGFSPQYVGTELHFKFPAFNQLGANPQSLADCIDYTYTLTGAGISPLECPVDSALSAGASLDWGVLGSPTSSTCDWGVIGGGVALAIDLGVLGR